MSAVVVIGVLLLLDIAANEQASPAPSWLFGLLLLSTILLALPTPFVFLDTAKDPQVWSPASDWSAIERGALVLSKVIPTFALFAIAVLVLLHRGFWLRSENRDQRTEDDSQRSAARHP